MEEDDMDENKYIAYCFFNDITQQDCLWMLLSRDKHFEKYSQEGWFLQHFGSGDVDALARNKLMHALNGNIVVQNQEEVDAMPSIITAAETSTQMRRFEPYEYRNRIQFQRNNVPADIADARYIDRIHANAIRADNTIISNCTQSIPVTNLIVRDPRPVAAGAPVNSTTRLPTIVGVGCDYYGSVVAPTEQGQNLAAKAAEFQTSVYRNNTQAINGFPMIDVVALASATTMKGLTLETHLLKVVAWLDVLSHARQARYIPRSVYGNADVFSDPADTDPTLEYGGAVFGENCNYDDPAQGDGPVFPYGGDSGDLAFHVTLDTVPDNQKDCAVIVTPEMLNCTENMQEALALSIFCEAPYPVCLPIVRKDTVHRAGGANAARQHYVPTSSLISVPGMKTIHVVLPRDTQGPNPTTHAQAIAVSMIHPRTGPTAIPQNVMAANALMTVNAVGIQIVRYSLCAYLMTWLQTFDQTTISLYLGVLGRYMQISDGLYKARETLAFFTQYTHPLIAAATEATAIPTANTLARYIRANGHVMRETTADWPQGSDISPDFRINKVDPLSWNKVKLRLATVPSMQPEGLGSVPQFVVDPLTQLDAAIIYLAQACAWDAFRVLWGISSDGWDQATRDTQYPALQFAHALYADTGSGGIVKPGQLSKVVHNIFRHLFQSQLTYAQSREPLLGKESEYTCFDECLIPNEHTCPTARNTTTRYKACLPIVLSDTWHKILSDRECKAIAAFPPPGGKEGAAGYSQLYNPKLAQIYIGGNAITPYCGKENNVWYYNTNQLPDVMDEAVYNERLFYTNGGCSMVDQRGDPIQTPTGANNALVAGFPPANSYPFQTPLVRANTENPPPGLLAATTLVAAYVGRNSVRQYLSLPQAQATQIVHAMQRYGILQRDTWQLTGVAPRATFDRDGSEKSRTQMLCDRMVKSGFGEEASTGSVPQAATPALVASPAVLSTLVNPASSANSVPPLGTILAQDPISSTI
jgi:hypothetical protein